MCLSCLWCSLENDKESLLGTSHVVIHSITYLLSFHTYIYFYHSEANVNCYAALLHLSRDRKHVYPHLWIFVWFRAFIASLSVGNRIRIFKITKRKDSSSSSFAAADAEDFKKVHKSDIINVGISSTGKFIMSASKDTTMIVWSLKGQKSTL